MQMLEELQETKVRLLLVLWLVMFIELRSSNNHRKLLLRFTAAWSMNIVILRKCEKSTEKKKKTPSTIL